MLPRTFANATVIVEQVSATEVRIRKADVASDAESPFAEEDRTYLSGRARDQFVELLEHPPSANEALKRAFRDQARQPHD
jgi:uncharacterized protein (DUF1778 family)